MNHLTILVAKDFAVTGTRPAGRAAMERVLGALRTAESVTLDFQEVILTPSFADEFIGGLISALGSKEFHDRVILSHLSASAAPLVRHVTHLRSGNRRTDEVHRH